MELGLVPLDFFSFKETGAFVGVEVGDLFVVREGGDKVVMAELDLIIDMFPMMSQSFAIDNKLEPVSKEEMFSLDVGAKVVLELGIEVIFFLGR